ncbi:tetratricopeptide repeat protein [Chryseobacterium sp.]|uniref:tetratricopeptide repeat protein n=1 Tax=Chryseobacterium sp. TaxID=1871047 RepID=UPI0011CC2A61|nr:tetratricopeptide repeat protein [Chryseobacterium sp.]TXF79244.1 tetratricopeptide repeat protein [Chryseobacterium sp.]
MKKQLYFLSFVFLYAAGYAQDGVKTADECFKKGDFKCAEIQYKALAEKEQIQKFKSNYYNSLGTAQRRLGKTSLAFKSYEQAMVSDPMSVTSYLNLGSMHSQKGSKAKALEYLNKGLQIDAENAELYLTRSKVYEDQGNKELAEKDLNTILTFAPENIFARTNLANLKKKKGDLEGSLKDFNQLISEKPESLLYNSRADVYLKLKKNKEALPDANKAIALDAKFSQAYVTKALILFDMGKKDHEACATLDKAVATGFEKGLLTELYKKCETK